MSGSVSIALSPLLDSENIKAEADVFILHHHFAALYFCPDNKIIQEGADFFTLASESTKQHL